MSLRFKIHPAIGIARVGNSSEFFLAPEVPGTFAQPSDGKYRDASGNLRRQAVRFRIFAHDDAAPGNRPAEVIAGSGGVTAIEWSVHLTNKKAVWYEFDGVTGEGPAGYPPGHPVRNAHIQDPARRRAELVIDAGPRSIAGPLQRVEVSRGGTAGAYPESWPPPLTGGKRIDALGTLSTDDAGRLIVAAGFGISGTTGPLPMDGTLRYDDNDFWFDDVSDGPVTARIHFANGDVKEADAPAWVIGAPPDYAPPLENLVTIYDLLYDLGLRAFGYDPSVFDPASQSYRPGFRPSFTRDIYPVLRRAFDYRWVIQQAARHQAGTFNWALLGQAPSAGEDPADNPRFAVFDRLRNPDRIDDPANPQRTMPRLHNDGTGGIPPETLRFTVTHTQYEFLRRWAAGQFVPDWTGAPPQPASEITPEGLDRAALEAGCGGSFFPGMEASWNLRDARVYVTPFEFRLRHAAAEEDPSGVTPGDVTKRSALPWQADFLKCGENWWPAQRPNQVRAAPTATTPSPWHRGIASHVDLVERWWKLGIVVANPDTSTPARYFEAERIL